MNLYTTNRDYYAGGQTLEQRSVYSSRANLVYQFDSGSWVALNGTFYVGGRTRLDGVLRDDLVQASRLGATLGMPVDRNNAVKLNVGNGVTARTGNTEFATIGIAWQHRWGGGL